MRIIFNVQLEPSEDFEPTKEQLDTIQDNIADALRSWADSGPGLMPDDVPAYTEGIYFGRRRVSVENE